MDVLWGLEFHAHIFPILLLLFVAESNFWLSGDTHLEKLKTHWEYGAVCNEAVIVSMFCNRFGHTHTHTHTRWYLFKQGKSYSMVSIWSIQIIICVLFVMFLSLPIVIRWCVSCKAALKFNWHFHKNKVELLLGPLRAKGREAGTTKCGLCLGCVV